jgi:hypothetical protein
MNTLCYDILIILEFKIYIFIDFSLLNQLNSVFHAKYWYNFQYYYPRRQM